MTVHKEIEIRHMMDISFKLYGLMEHKFVHLYLFTQVQSNKT